MKKSFGLFVLSLSAPFLSYLAAQNIFPNTGNVGIGTPAPGATLDVRGTIVFDSSSIGHQNVYLKSASGMESGFILYDGSTPRYQLYKTGANDFSLWNYTTASSAFTIKAQNGAVGIGTTSPNQALSINGNLSVGTTGSLILMGYSAYTGGGGYIQLRSQGDAGRDFAIQNYSNSAGWQTNLFVAGESGNVGIGTASPKVKLEVNGTVAAGSQYENVLKVGPLNDSPAYFYINTKIPFNDHPAPQLRIRGYNYSATNKAVSLTLSWYVYNNTFHWTQYKSDIGYHNPSRIRLGTYDDSGVARVRIEIANDSIYWTSYFISAIDHNGVGSNYSGWSYEAQSFPANTQMVTIVAEHAGVVFSGAGNLGVGTANPTHKLSVNGAVKAKEVIVETTGWSDYVLAPDYELQSLTEVEAHIEEHQHLPGIPSAKEIAEQGVSVGEMQAKLLAKIEELTLYLIAEEKKREEQATKITELENVVNTLRNRLSTAQESSGSSLEGGR